MVFNRIAIIGVGLIGGSVGLAIRRHHPNCDVVGVGPTDANFEAMTRAGAVCRGTMDLTAATTDADLTILATPVGAAIELLDRLKDSQGLVTDVLSTKRSITTAAAAKNIRFVGSHPMAGSERRGVENARANLLEGAVCLITPTPATALADVETVEKFWTSIGLTTRRMTPEIHDRLVAAASHAPHAAAAALVSIQSPESLAIAAGGLRDSTRLAGGDPDLWRDILLDNRDLVSAEVKKLRDELTQLAARLDAGDSTAIRDWLASAAVKRSSLGLMSRPPSQN